MVAATKVRMQFTQQSMGKVIVIPIGVVAEMVILNKLVKSYMDKEAVTACSQ